MALLALYGCWGSSIPAMALMVRSVPPLAGAGAIFTTGGLILLLLSRHAPRPTRRQMGQACVVGLLLLVGGQGLATVVVTRLSASLAAVLLATVPLWIAVLGRVRGAHLRMLTGLAGVAITVFTAPTAALGGSIVAVGGCLVASVLWAVGSLRASRTDRLPADQRLSTAIQLTTGGATLLVLAVPFGQLEPAAWMHAAPTSLAAAAFLLFADTLAGFGLYGHLLRTAPVSLVASYAYATPLVAAAIGFIALHNPIWPGIAAGAVLIITAVFLEVRATNRN